jgi:glycosyltransferase involved in cell wall biosynthesis
MTGYSHMTRAVLRMALVAGYEVQAVESDYRVEFTQYTDGRTEIEECPPSVKVPLPDCQWTEVEDALKKQIPEEAPTLLIQLPPNLSRRGRWTRGARIGWTMIESDTCHPKWTKACWGVDSLLVPSRYNVDAFTRAGFTHVRRMPIPVDDRIWTIDCPPLEIRDRPTFLFLSVFSTTERKQWRLLMQAFTEEFADEDVGLMVHPSHSREVHELATWCREAGANIIVDDVTRTDFDMVALYKAADCFALPSPEGFGLPFIEAAMAGLPSVALDKGGSAEFVNLMTGYPVMSYWCQLIGHLPNVYPSHHRFPLTTINALRSEMRIAYNHPKYRGAMAKHFALTCYTPDALAPQFREEIERAESQRVCLQNAGRNASIQTNGNLPQYALAFGAWGDVFCSIGMAQAMRNPSRPIHVLNYSMDPAVADFLREQPFIDAVHYYPPACFEDFTELFHKACMSRFTHYDRWLIEFADFCNVPACDILYSQINQQEDQPVARWHDAALPAGIRCWAHTQARIWGDYILLHPISTQSAKIGEHWPHWEAAVRWLVEETPYTYVLTGIADMDVPASDRLINLIGRTENMMQVLALCEKSKGVISTCNAVSIWTVMQDIPGLIVANSVFNEKADYYHRWINTAPNTLLYQYDTLQWFKSVASEWLERRMAQVPE